MDNIQIDFHVHSKYSFDSLLKPEKIIKVAKRRGLSGVAVTDHDTVIGGLELIKANSDDFFAISGTEIGTDMGDILGLFLNEEIKSRSALEVIDEIKEKGGIAVLPHPYKRTNEINEEIIRRIDAIEGFNARGEQPDFRQRNKMARSLAMSKQIPMTGGSDAHFYFEIGGGRCIIEGVSDMEDIRKSILKNKTRLIGVESSMYVEPLSQVIRMVKLRRLDLLLRISYKTFKVTQFYARKKVLKTINPLGVNHR